nr:serine hydrolase [Rubellimicrobium sp. CFH 75288]
MAWSRGDGPARFACAARPGLAFGSDTLWRAASLSKMVTAASLQAIGGPAIWERPAAEVLDRPLRHPSGICPTLGQIASHTASLTDAAGYALAPGDRLADWLDRAGDRIWHPDMPGTRLAYANFGSLLLAAAAERLSGLSLDRLARERVLDPLGVEGGFAWSGLSAARRRDRMPALRPAADGFVAAADGAVPPCGLALADGTPLAPAPPGVNPSPLGPQGGLRLSLRGALRLAQTLAAATPSGWTRPARAEPPVVAAAPGLLRLEAPEDHPRPLTGHWADAYGIRAGAWTDGTGLAFAYVLNGCPETEEDGLSPPERAILRAVAAL